MINVYSNKQQNIDSFSIFNMTLKSLRNCVKIIYYAVTRKEIAVKLLEIAHLH